MGSVYSTEAFPCAIDPGPSFTRTQTLTPVLTLCPVCQHRLYADYANVRTVTTLAGVTRLILYIRRCHNHNCSRSRRPYRPEAESHFALPHHEFGLDVIACVGRLRYGEHRSIPEIHHELTRRGVVLAQRSVLNLLEDAATRRTARPWRPLLIRNGCNGCCKSNLGVVLAIDGLQPDVGHEVLWVLRDCVSGEILLARSLLSATSADLATLLSEVREGLAEVPITGVISDGQQTIRQAVAQELPGVPHQLCPLPLHLRGGRPADLRSGPPCQERTEEADPGRYGRSNAAAKPTQTMPRPTWFGSYCASGAVRLDRRRATAALVASGLRLPARAAGNHRRQPGPGRGFGGDIAGRAEETAVLAEPRSGRDRGVVAAGAVGLSLGGSAWPRCWPTKRSGQPQTYGGGCRRILKVRSVVRPPKPLRSRPLAGSCSTS